MDSGNSGSLQSSSGGDEEYDSRAADSVSAFMSIHPTTHVGPISNPPPPSLFDPLSNYLQLQNPNSSLLNSNMLWPRNNSSLRSDPNSTHDIINPMLSSSNPFMNSFQAPATVGVNNNNSSAAVPPVQNLSPAARNPKKRSRASRRAPTTVLNTDTTNFRAMVQEFTGIPAPPFNNSPFSRNRLDLFSTRYTTMDSTQPTPYLRRPFAQKVQSPPSFLGSASSSSSTSSSLLSSSAIDAIAASSTTNNNNIITSVTSSTIAAASNSTPSINYQLPITQSSNLFNISNPLLTSLLQSNTKFPFSNSSFLGSKPLEIPSNDHSHIKMGSLDEFGLGHGTVSGLPNLISSTQTAPRNYENNSVSPNEGNDHQDQMRLVNGNYNFPRHSKINYSDSSSSFHGEKGPENVTTRGEGMVESWICSSE